MEFASVPCVVYAAKSTQDRRGSIPTQLEDCRAAIEGLGDRVIAGEYTDEAVSAYTANRGAGLVGAMRQVADLAALYTGAELWVQHSDRLARGDGRAARHVVEIALWANKSDVGIRSLQDPDTFRDLLYAVVSGQRNHLDSQRKGASVSAGLRRSVARGAYAGVRVDGYRVVVTVSHNNVVTKHLEIDPERAPLIRKIFALALDGSTPWQIAEAVTTAGWMTTGKRTTGGPKRFEAWGILRVLNNPRYAGLSQWKGEILAVAEWPAFISPEQFAALRQRARRPTSLGPRPKQPFLLVGVARCGECLCTMHAITGVPRRDGTQQRSYLCSGHAHKHCEARRTDAAAVDSVFIENLDRFLRQDPVPVEQSPGKREDDERSRQLKRRISVALIAEDYGAARTLFDELREHIRIRHVEPESEQPQQAAHDLRTGLLAEFHAWRAACLDHPAKITLAETERLRDVLRHWFERIELRPVAGGFEMTPVLHDARSGKSIQTDYGQWRLSLCAAGYIRPIGAGWTAEEIIVSMHQWHDQHGEPPASTDWRRATQSHPMYSSVHRIFGSWRSALLAAGYSQPRPKLRPRIARSRDNLGHYST